MRSSGNLEHVCDFLDCQHLLQTEANLTGPLKIRKIIQPSARAPRKDGAIEDLVEEIMEIGRHCAALPLRDTRSPDEIIGYDEHGLPQ